MELITRKAVGRFCSTPSKIIRDGTGAYLYRRDNSEIGSYHDGKEVKTAKKDTIYHAGHFFKIKF